MSSSSAREQWITLCKATLEGWCHLLLYVRQVYPRDSFTSTCSLDVPCMVNRHAGVVDCIRNFCDSAAPAIASNSIREVSLVIMKNHLEELETFSLTFDDVVIDESSTSLEHVERSMRNLLLAVQSLEGAFDNDTKLGHDASFKLTMKKQAEEASAGTLRPLHYGTLSRGTFQMSLITHQT